MWAFSFYGPCGLASRSRTYLFLSTICRQIEADLLAVLQKENLLKFTLDLGTVPRSRVNFAVLENCFFEIGDTMVQVNSEIGPLKKVMLHRPGNELKRVHPFHLQEMLFEDTPLLEKAQAEHDTFAGILRENGVEILYQEDMFAQAMKNESERSAFVEEFLDRSAIPSIGLRDRLAEYYNGLPLDEFVERVYTGVLKSEFDGGDSLGGCYVPR